MINIKIVGQGLVGGNINVPEGALVTLTATPFAGFEFDRWHAKMLFTDYSNIYLGVEDYLIENAMSNFDIGGDVFEFHAYGDIEITAYFKDKFIESITDRSVSDLINRTPKAYMNSEDWNRIESNIGLLATILAVPLTTNYWDKNSIPTRERIDLILQNVGTLRRLRTPFNAPAVPKHPINDYQKINDIELILQMIHDLFYSQNEYVNHCGEMYSGDGIGVL